MYVDLHIHSTFSDSTRTPENIVSQAVNKNVSLLSVCDHGTIDAYDRLITACGQSDISCIVGIELGADLGESSYHVLAYSFDKQNNEMRDYIKLQQDVSRKECENMISKMSADFPQCSLYDYLAYEYPKDAGGWKYIHYAVAKGIFETYEEAGAYIFPHYFESGEDTYPVEEFCGLVKRAGGVPTLAHPRNDSRENLFAHFREMQDRGMEGIECYYPSHSKETTEICLEYCHKNNMRITCGSDCHGDYDKSEGFTIGSMQVSVDMLDLKDMLF